MHARVAHTQGLTRELDDTGKEEEIGFMLGHSKSEREREREREGERETAGSAQLLLFDCNCPMIRRF